MIIFILICLLLRLSTDYDNKPIILLSPDVRIQTESRKHKNAALQSDSRKKSLIDSGIELLFKKSSKSFKDGGISNSHQNISHPLSCDNKFSTEISTVPTNYADGENSKYHSGTTDEHHKWKLFDTIKIHTDKRRSIDPSGILNDLILIHLNCWTISNFCFFLSTFSADVHIGEECSTTQVIETTQIYKLHNDTALLDSHGSPRKKLRAMLSGNKQIDQLLHTIINYILRDFIDSWFFSLSDNKEFSEFRTRNCIEESVQNVCTRVKNQSWVPLMTTKLVDIVATHARLYRKANATLNLQLDETKSTLFSGSNQFQTNTSNSSPQRRVSSNNRKINQHRRNKSETDLNFGYQNVQRTFGNSKFYDSMDHSQKKSTDKIPVGDASEAKLITAFFNQCELYKEECLDDQALEGTL